MPEIQPDQEEFEAGVVTGIQGDDALVKLNLQPACEACGARLLCIPDDSGNRILRAANPLHAAVGSRVAIAEQGGFLLRLAALQYGIPFIGFLAGIFIIYALKINLNPLPPELTMFIGGLTGLFSGALNSWKLAGKIAGSGKTFFEIVKIFQ